MAIRRRSWSTISVQAEVDIDDVLSEIDDDVILEELKSRNLAEINSSGNKIIMYRNHLDHDSHDNNAKWVIVRDNIHKFSLSELEEIFVNKTF